MCRQCLCFWECLEADENRSQFKQGEESLKAEAFPPGLCGPVSSLFGVSFGVPNSEGKIIENFVLGKRYHEHQCC